MKKSLIALAALAATTAFAQSSVQVVGTFDPSIASTQTTYGNNTSVTNQSIRNNTQGTSQVTFKGTEDLGGGLKANFLIENDFDAGKDARNGAAGIAGASNSNLGSLGGEMYLNLEGGFGKIALGAPNTPTLFSQSANPFGTKVGGGFAQLNSGKVRNNNTVMYSTPAMAGFTGHIAYSNKTKDSAGLTTAADITDIGLFYANGPLAVMFSNYKVAATATVAEKTDNNLTAVYDLGVAKLGVAYFTQKQTALADAKGTQVFATVPLSAQLNLLANFGQNDSALATNLDSKITAVGLKYSFSKMTSVYARIVDQTYDNVAATAATTKKVQTTAIGMQTNF
jgi:predicted porin